jgi:hypothetical protein
LQSQSQAQPRKADRNGRHEVRVTRETRRSTAGGRDRGGR